MDTLGPSPFLWLELDKNGAIDPALAEKLASLLNQPDMTDLVVMSHGWKNTKDDARKLYGTLWANARKKLAPEKASHTVVAGVVWPAKAYRTDFDTETLVTGGGGAQAADGTPAPVKDLAEADFKDVLADFEDLFGPD